MKKILLTLLLLGNSLYAGDPNRTDPISFIVRRVNLNSANTDVGQISVPFYSRYIVRKVIVTNVNGDLGATSTCTLGVFTGAGGTGTTVVSLGTMSGVRGVNNYIDLTNALTNTVLTSPTLFVRIGTAQGSAVSADVYVFVDPLET